MSAAAATPTFERLATVAGCAAGKHCRVQVRFSGVVVDATTLDVVYPDPTKTPGAELESLHGDAANLVVKQDKMVRRW